MYVENPKESTKMALELSEFSKDAGHKVNIEKLMVFLYISTE